MCEQNDNNENAQPQSAQQPIIINNVMAQPDDSGKKKAPGFIKVCVYSFLTCARFPDGLWFLPLGSGFRWPCKSSFYPPPY